MSKSRSTLTAVVVVVMILMGTAAYLLTRGSPSSGPRKVSVLPTSTTPQSAGIGWLHTAGTRIADVDGATVQLTGLNVSGLEGSNPNGSSTPGQCHAAWKELTPAEVEAIASYGYRTVRLPIAWANLEPTAPVVGAGGVLAHTWNTSYLSALDAELSLFADHGISVILDMHQSTWSFRFKTGSDNQRPGCPGSGMPGWLNPNAEQETANEARCAFLANRTEAGVPGTDWTDFTAAWTLLADHYAEDSTVVGLDLLNEPYCQAADLNPFYASVVPDIHAADPRALLMLEDKDAPGTYELTELPKVANVVLSIHLHEDYWTSPSAGQTTLPASASVSLAANQARAAAWSVPLYIGEFYAFDGAGVQEKGKNTRDANFVRDTRDFVTYAHAHDISWTYWAWITDRNTTRQPSLPAEVQSALSST